MARGYITRPEEIQGYTIVYQGGKYYYKDKETGQYAPDNVGSQTVEPAARPGTYDFYTQQWQEQRGEEAEFYEKLGYDDYTFTSDSPMSQEEWAGMNLWAESSGIDISYDENGNISFAYTPEQQKINQQTVELRQNEMDLYNELYDYTTGILTGDTEMPAAYQSLLNDYYGSVDEDGNATGFFKTMQTIFDEAKSHYDINDPDSIFGQMRTNLDTEKANVMGQLDIMAGLIDQNVENISAELDKLKNTMIDERTSVYDKLSQSNQEMINYMTSTTRDYYEETKQKSGQMAAMLGRSGDDPAFIKSQTEQLNEYIGQQTSLMNSQRLQQEASVGSQFAQYFYNIGQSQVSNIEQGGLQQLQLAQNRIGTEQYYGGAERQLFGESAAQQANIGMNQAQAYQGWQGQKAQQAFNAYNAPISILGGTGQLFGESAAGRQAQGLSQLQQLTNAYASNAQYQTQQTSGPGLFDWLSLGVGAAAQLGGAYLFSGGLSTAPRAASGSSTLGGLRTIV